MAQGPEQSNVCFGDLLTLVDVRTHELVSGGITRLSVNVLLSSSSLPELSCLIVRNANDPSHANFMVTLLDANLISEMRVQGDPKAKVRRPTTIQEM
jgi:hypothetical protein